MKPAAPSLRRSSAPTWRWKKKAQTHNNRRWKSGASSASSRLSCGCDLGAASDIPGAAVLKLAELERDIADLRALFRGEKVAEPTSGAEYHLNYLSGPMEIPIYIAASAPKILLPPPRSQRQRRRQKEEKRGSPRRRAWPAWGPKWRKSWSALGNRRGR